MLELIRRNPDFRKLFGASVVSLGGDWFATVALIGLVTELGKGTWLTPALGAGLVLISQALPAFFITPIAGPFADRLDRKKIMLGASLLQACSALLFLVVDRDRLWLAFAAQALIAVLAGFFSPASQASLANLVSPQDLPRAAAILGTTWGTMLAVGASLGAWFSTVFGRNAAFIADAISFLVAASFIVRIRGNTRANQLTTRARMRPIADTRAALSYARRDPSLTYLLFSKGGFGLSSGVVGVLTSLATTRFRGGDLETGILLGARGIGVVIGPLIAGKLGAAKGVPGILRACAMSCMIYGVAYFAVGHAPSLWLCALLAVIAHLGGGTQWTLSTIGLQTNTADEFRGRIMSADFALVSLSMSISFVVAGLLDKQFGATTALTALSTLSIVWGLIYLRATNALARRPAAASTAL